MLKLNELDERLRRRIQRQIDQEDAAKRQSMAPRLRPELQPVVPQTLVVRPPGQAQSRKGVPLCRVLIVRYGKRRLDDDNLAISYKHLRDIIAAELGVDDGDPRIKFDYDQVTTKGAIGTHVLITATTDNRKVNVC